MNNEENYETIEIKIPNNISNISEEKINEYKNSKEWEELDDLFKTLQISEEHEIKDILLKIISYGEIVKVKYDYKMNNLNENDILSQEFILIPIYMNMLPERAIDLISKRYSDDENLIEESMIQLDEIMRDNKIDELIEILKNARKAEEHEIANGAMGELYRYKEYALPKLKLVSVDPKTSQNLLNDLGTIIITIILGEEEYYNLFQKAIDEDPEIWKPAQKRIRDIINSIDVSPYLLRHPEELPNIEI